MKASTYPKIAQAIKENSGTYLDEYNHPIEFITKTWFIAALCSILKADNPKFDENKFRESLR